MKVVIPAAGAGTRLRPHTYTTPKSLLPVAGKPILGHILDGIKGFDVSEVIIIVGSYRDRIEDFVRESYSFKTRYVEQKELRGLGYAVYLAADYFGDEPIFIVLGDTIYKADLDTVFRNGGNYIGVKSVKDPRRFGVAEVEADKITRLIEKPENPTSNLAVVGLYYIEDSDVLKSSLKEIVEGGKRTKGEYQLTDALQIMIEKGAELKVFDVDGWYDCGKPETLLSTNRYLLNEMESSEKIKGSIIIPPVFVPPSAKIDNSIIGPYVSIGDGAKISNSIIRDSIIGRETEVERSVFELSLIGDFARIKTGVQRLNIGSSSEIVINSIDHINSKE